MAIFGSHEQNTQVDYFGLTQKIAYVLQHVGRLLLHAISAISILLLDSIS